MISAPPSRELSIDPDASSVLIPAIAITRRRFASESHDLSLLQIATLVVWIACLGAGGLGLALHYSRPAPKAVLAPIQAEILDVELTSDPLPRSTLAPAPANLPSPPPMPETPTPPPQAPALTAVAEPSPAIAFAVPVAGPVQIVEAKHAAPVRETPPAPAAPAPAPQKLVFGQGEGRQPGPQYPLLAQRQGQEGVVGVRFAVGESGDVLSAEAVNPSPWPLLNREAIRTIRHRWQFQPGAVRMYAIDIRFELQK